MTGLPRALALCKTPPTASRERFDSTSVNRLWYLLILMLPGCDVDPTSDSRPDVEATHLETQQIRKAVDDYKANPTRQEKALVDAAFAEFDQELEELKQDAQLQTGDEQAAAEERIADLKHRRDLHWARCQATPVPTEVRTAAGIPVRRAERVKPQ